MKTRNLLYMTGGVFVGIGFLYLLCQIGWKDIVINVVSDIVTILLLLLVAWLILVLTNRNRLLDFFGVRKSRKIVVYLSNIRVIQGGSQGIDGQIRSYFGSAVVFSELFVATKFDELFSYPLPTFDDKPGILRKLLLTDVTVKLLLSPLNDKQLESAASFITFGSPGYNKASDFFEQKGSMAHFCQENGQMVVNGVTIPNDGIYGFVERIVETEKDRSLYYVAGTTEPGTRGAADYLVTQWEKLQKRYGNEKDFVVVLKIHPEGSSTIILSHEREEKRK
jgi:hypothetical protein